MGKKGTNRIVLRIEASVFAGSESRLLRILESLSKAQGNPVNPVK
jgi:hypothetical protein